ncbi:uncharacterized protein LOC129310794 [Prosopis cineraria]|uniref:uncharacterized protein LOC129310794 n=1 Tax=Prosopis cineraria TaxID=364024 RepID=UPI00240EA753|nr:uncharacterized protein LOC129310794 [Prosopis cineraria]
MSESEGSIDMALKQFTRLNPSSFEGFVEDRAAEKWIDRLETIFLVMTYTTKKRVLLATFMLEDAIDTLFNSGAIHYFISDDCAKRLKLHVLEMPFSMNLSILAGASVRTSQACLKLKLKFGDRVTVIDLIYLPLSGIDVIVEMNWLFANGATLECNRKIVSLPIYTATFVNLEPIKSLSVMDYETFKFLSALQVENSMKEGCQVFMVYCSTHDVYDGGIDMIGAVNEFLKVFHDRMLGLPPEREIEFSIDLVPNIEPIFKAPYRMAPVKLEELKRQLEELLEKGFIWPSVSPWELPVLFVKKKDRSMILCINYR